jgi:hypothetical protein
MAAVTARNTGGSATGLMLYMLIYFSNNFMIAKEI